METLVLDKALIVIFGTVISILLAVIGWFLSQTHRELKSMLHDHEVRIQGVERHKERTEVHHINTQIVHAEIKEKLATIETLVRG